MHSQSPTSLLVAAFLACPFLWQAEAATGGPDAFGYTFIDSLEPAGPTFMGVDISGTGMAVGNGDDVALPVMLGRAVNVYGTEYTNLFLGSNGFVTDQGSAAGDLSNDCPLPSPPSTGTGFRIYALHDDLDLEAGTGQGYYEYFASCPRAADRGTGTIGCSVFMWDEVEHFPGGGGTSWDQWVYIYDNCDIVVEIGTGNPELGSGSTTGIQDETGTIGLTAQCDTAGSVPDNYVVLFQFPCDQASGALGGGIPATTSLVLNGPTVIDASAGTINGMPDPAYAGGGVFSYIDIDIQAGATVTFSGATAPELRAVGNITIDGAIDLDGTIGINSGNGVVGGALVPGVAGGGFGGAGGCATGWQSRQGMRGGGSTGGFAGSHPPGSGGFADVTGGGGGGNGTAGADGDMPIGAFATEPGRGGCANIDPLFFPLRGGGGGGGGGCDVDDASGPISTGTANDGGSSGGSGGGAIRFQSGGNITVGAGATITARGGEGGDNTGNGGSAGGGAGGTVLLIAGGDLVVNGAITATGGPGGTLMQAGAGANGGAGGDGIIGLYDSDGVIGGAGPIMPAAITGTSPVFTPNDLNIANKDLPNASPSQPYMATIQATGGSGAYMFSVTGGALPGGLMLDAMTGAITGTSTSIAGTRDEFTITVDDGMTTFDRAFCIQTNLGSLALTTDSLPPTDPMMMYSQSVASVGGAGATTYTVVDGALPTGLALDAMTGLISGMTGPNFEGATFAVSAINALDEVDVQTYCILVGQVPTSTPILAPLPAAEECVPYSETLTVQAGMAPYSFEVLGGALPAGFTLDPMTGTISGTAMAGDAAMSPFNICLYVYDAVGLLGKVSLDFEVVLPSSPPTCMVTGPMTPPAAGGTITLPISGSGGGCAMAFDVVAVEYSLDGGMTFVGNCTPTAASPIMPPQMGVSTAAPVNFEWASSADIATMALESNVVVRVTVMDPFGMSTCDTAVFEVDNQCLCGDCDLSGSLPVAILDALVAAQIAAGLVMPTSLQLRCCDTNAGGTVEITDALRMAQAAAGLPVMLMCP